MLEDVCRKSECVGRCSLIIIINKLIIRKGICKQSECEQDMCKQSACVVKYWQKIRMRWDIGSQ
jgi:hypothetical protein